VIIFACLSRKIERLSPVYLPLYERFTSWISQPPNGHRSSGTARSVHHCDDHGLVDGNGPTNLSRINREVSSERGKLRWRAVHPSHHRYRRGRSVVKIPLALMAVAATAISLTACSSGPASTTPAQPTSVVGWLNADGYTTSYSSCMSNTGLPPSLVDDGVAVNLKTGNGRRSRSTPTRARRKRDTSRPKKLPGRP
jgi:hypothetical protein